MINKTLLAKRFSRFATALLLVFATTYSLAQDTSVAVDGEKILKIGTKNSPPMSMKSQNGDWEGISIELWKKVASELHLRYEFVEMPLPELLQAVKSSELDAVVGSLSITSEREKVLDFSQPFFYTGLSIAIRNQSLLPVIDVLDAIFSLRFIAIVGVLILVLLLVGTSIWLFENRKNPEQFGGHFLKGIGSGVWLSAVTMTTVGYGDKSPKTFGGRIFVLIWMFMSLIITSSLTAAITSALTVERINSKISQPSDLARMHSATAEGSSSALWLKDSNYSFSSFPDLKAALGALDEGQYDAVVYDEPLLRYSVLTEFPGLKVLPLVFSRQSYGFAFPSNSPLRESVNLVLLKALQKDEWGNLVSKYLGSEMR
jgi:ABC-type amino acid transport substrate-binding protein